MSKSTDLVKSVQGTVTDVKVIDVMHRQFSKSQIYLTIGPSIMLAINPFRALDIYDEETGTKALDRENESPAHIYSLAVSCFEDMHRQKRSQAVIIQGESGSGKSETCNKFIYQLLSLSYNNPSKEDVLLKTKIMQFGSILEAFGHAKTKGNKSSSRYGKFVNFSYMNDRLFSFEVFEYMLERSRVSSIPEKERSFHIFYSVVGGLKSSEIGDLHLAKFPEIATAVQPEDIKLFKKIKRAFKEIPSFSTYQMYQVLSAVLHLQKLEFTKTTIDGIECCVVKNSFDLEVISALLMIDSNDLSFLITTRTKQIKKETCTVFLDPEDCFHAAISLSKSIYVLLFKYIVDCINRNAKNTDKSFRASKKLTFMNTLESTKFIGLLDFPGLEDHSATANRYDQFIFNYADELMNAYMNKHIFEMEIGYYTDENYIPEIKNIKNSNNQPVIDQLELMMAALHSESVKTKGKDSTLMELFNKVKSPVFSSVNEKQFQITHFINKKIKYEVSKFIDRNRDIINPDMISIFKTANQELVRNIVNGPYIESAVHPKDPTTVVQAHIKPERSPVIELTDLTQPDDQKIASNKVSLSGNLSISLLNLVNYLQKCDLKFILCLIPNSNLKPEAFERNVIGEQLRKYQVLQIVELKKLASMRAWTAEQFLFEFVNNKSTKLSITDETINGKENKEKCKEVVKQLAIKDEDVHVGENTVFIKDSAINDLYNKVTIQRIDLNSQMPNVDLEIDPEPTPEVKLRKPDEESGNKGNTTAKAAEPTVPQKKKTKQRRRWETVTKFCTWWIPDVFIRSIGIKNPDVMMAWREKVTLCSIIFFLSCFLYFYVIGIPYLLCPQQYLYNINDLTSLNNKGSILRYAQGVVFDLNSNTIANAHANQNVNFTADLDVTKFFSFEAYYKDSDCSDFFTGNPKTTTSRPVGTDSFQIGCVIGTSAGCHSLSAVSSYSSLPKTYSFAMLQSSIDGSSSLITVNSKVYDVSNLPNSAPLGLQFTRGDNTAVYNKLSTAGKSVFNKCMTPFYVGKIDTRFSVQCTVTSILLLGSTALVAGLMAIKFLSALQFLPKPIPEDLEKFVILQVPCYTEGEDSLRKTIDSLSKLVYDDDRKLLFIVADGMVIGSGNDRPTPRIVLDILGVDPSIDPEPKSFISVGEGSKQHNMGKVYSGIYECQGRRVPFVVVVKVGKPSERSKPGNRGKRDSQMILMKFLNKVHFKTPMYPMELEMYDQIKNVIGVDPEFYEYILMVDADTEVMPDSLTRMVSKCILDSKIMGICGETQIANEGDSIITMIQVYEYYISHHLAKAFESLFGTVTCLPGCFSMYKIRTSGKNQPLIISNEIIEDYSENIVDTLHKKNLLSLGEDRYLTTLLLKHFPGMRTKFTPEALCKTVAPDSWSVLLSQRRRWINSTIHNLFELLYLDQLCGFCVLSMRFVVFLDLFATLVMPATFLYLIYLIWASVDSQTLPTQSLIILGCAYGMQVIIFMLKLQFQHLIWMLINILAMPIFSFFVPLYAFWHFDDFSWGNTRLVLGENGKLGHVGDEEHFDPTTIPTTKWEDYEAEIIKTVQAAALLEEQNANEEIIEQEADGQVSKQKVKQTVVQIMDKTNLSQLTKKKIREEVGQTLACDLEEWKEYINQVIEEELIKRS